MRVIIVDDQEIMRQGLAMILNRDDIIEVVGTATNGKEAVRLCSEIEVDVILMDINMPVMNGVEATKAIKAVHPDIKILVLTTFNDDEFIFGSLRNGASGYLLKDASPLEITEGIKTVFDGGTLMNPSVATKVVKKLSDKEGVVQLQIDQRVAELTNREVDICHYLGEGHNNKEIGEALFISEGTVKNNITRILDKLDLRDRTQLALFAMKNQV